MHNQCCTRKPWNNNNRILFENDLEFNVPESWCFQTNQVLTYKQGPITSVKNLTISLNLPEGAVSYQNMALSWLLCFERRQQQRASDSPVLVSSWNLHFVARSELDVPTKPLSSLKTKKCKCLNCNWKWTLNTLNGSLYLKHPISKSRK